jgi:hypothetical protein
MGQHAVLAPSNSETWMVCHGAPAMRLGSGAKDEDTVYSKEGTQAHDYAAWLLRGAKPPVPPADREMVDFVSMYTNAVRAASKGKILLVEQSVNVSEWTTEPGGKGTSDAVIVDVEKQEMEVWDLKYGKGHIVHAENNKQMQIYALGNIRAVEAVFGKMKSVKMVIFQPRRDHAPEWTISRDQLLAFGAEVQKAGAIAMGCISGVYDPLRHLHASTEGCLWCPLKATCVEFRKHVNSVVFEDLSKSDKVFRAKLPTPEELQMVSQYVAAVKAQIDSDLFAGRQVAGWKLVLGRKGNRAWGDNEAQAEQLIRDMRILVDDAYDKTLKTPTQLQKIIPSKKWEKLELLVTQSDPKPTVAPETDNRDAWKPNDVKMEAIK